MRSKCKFFVAFLVLCMILTGCSLAVENAEFTSGEDKLVGVLVTKEHLSLEDKLYAIESKDDASGISFENIEGLILLRLVEQEEGGEPYSTTKCSDGISDVHNVINVTDEGEENAVSAMIYAYPTENGEDIFYANPIYQSADESIYTLGGGGYGLSTSGGEGQQMATSFSTETKETLNGESKIEKSSVEIKYSLMYKPVEIILYQMDENHEVISKETYEPGKLPDKIKAESKTAYFLIETVKEDLEGNSFIMRDLFEQEPEGNNILNTYCVLKDGILTEQETEIIWDDQRE